jgi:hypothetical protein
MSAILPSKNTAKIVEEFIRYAQQHLSTISGLANTVSVFPSAPSPVTLPSVVNWTGYFVPPPIASFDVNTTAETELNEQAEAEGVKIDIEREYPLNLKLYEAQFDTPEEAFNNNKDVTIEEALNNIEQYNIEKNSNNGNDDDIYANDAASVAGSTGAAIVQKKVSTNTRSIFQGQYPTQNQGGGGGGGGGGGAKGDIALFNKCGNGEWPAVGTPGNFQVRKEETAGTKNGVPCPRYWYVQNTAFIKKNCTEILFPTNKGDVKIQIHKDFVPIVQPAIDKIRSLGLVKYINNCAGGLAIRNVTCGTRLTNHSWGTAIDMNTVDENGKPLYPYNTSFRADGIYSGKVKKRDFTEFDLGFQKVAQVFVSVGMTWLKNNDPMHVSIYE